MQVLNAAKAAGYKSIFVSEALMISDGDCIPRIAVKKDWSSQRFRQALEGHVPAGEAMAKTFKNFLQRGFGHANYDRFRSVLLKKRT